MANYKFRLLRADEIECRIAIVKNSGVQLLLYKDARCDMNILDETVGADFWKRNHVRDNANCIVSIWNDLLKQWISKEDTGVPSNSEPEKGIASDSFKRACVNWGIGRELYTAPFIWINDAKVETKNGKLACKEKFSVSHIAYDEQRVITELIIVDAYGNIRYKMGKNTVPTEPKEPKEDIAYCEHCKSPVEKYISPEGKIYSAKAIVNNGLKKYGKVLCSNCQTKMKKLDEIAALADQEAVDTFENS